MSKDEEKSDVGLISDIDTRPTQRVSYREVPTDYVFIVTGFANENFLLAF